MAPPEPYISDPENQSSGRPATFIFLHGFADDAEGIPLGLAQQFQFNHKLPYLKWLLPNAGRHPEAMDNAWYMPKALPNAMKPRIPGHEEDEDSAADDEEGILASCDRIDELVRKELDSGVEKERIVVGGFSQGCAVSLVWGLVGKEKDNVAGLVPVCGYFPLAGRIAAIRKARGYNEKPEKESETRKWFLGHGDRDALVPQSLFARQKEELALWVDSEKDVEAHLYERMGHSTSPALLRDLLGWFNRVVPQ